MNIRTNLLTPCKYSRCEWPLMDVMAIVNHWVEGVIHWVKTPEEKNEEVRLVFEYLKYQDEIEAKEKKKIKKRYASTHYSICDYDILNMVPEGEITFNCGGDSYTKVATELFGAWATSNVPGIGSSPNYHTISIEWNHIDWAGRFSEETYYTATLLNADLCRRYNLDPMRNILRHYDVTKKECPKWFVDHQGDWGRFLNDVKKES